MAQADSQCLKFVMPPTFKPGVYAWRLNGQFQGLLNRPAIWWVQGEQRPGGTLRICGKNLGQQAVVLLKGVKTRRVAAVADRYTLSATLPTDLAVGDYEVRVHNGFGGGMAWSEPVALTVRAAAPWPATVTAVKADATGTQDETAAIQEALDAAGKAGGGVVLLPRGRFQVNAQLEIPRFVTLRGAGRELTCLLWPDMATPPEALIHGTNSFAVEDLTVYASNHHHVLVADTGDKPGAGHVAFRRLRVRANTYRGHLKTEEVDAKLRESLTWSSGGGDTVRAGGDDVQITDCDLYGSGRVMYLSQVRGGLVRGNRLFNGRWGWYCFSGNNGLIFEDNTLTGADLQSTGGGLNCLDGSMSSENVYYARNTLDLMHGWDREAMTSDAGGGPYFGGVVAVNGATLTLAEDAKADKRDWKGAGCFILQGRGRGQWRRIVSLEGRQVTLDRPFVVAPDATSQVALTMFQGRYLFADNHFTDSGVAIQLYGMACEAIADGNVSTRTGGFHNFGMDYQGIQPSWYVQWLNNQIAEGNVYRSGHDNYLLAGEAHLGIMALPPRADFPACLTLGCIARGNRLHNNAHLALGGSDPANATFERPFVQEVVAEHNVIEHADTGVWIRKAQSGTLLRDNRCEDVAVPLRDELADEKAAEARRAKLIAEPGPLVWYSFEKTRPERVPDATGRGFTATVQGKLTLGEGKHGQGASLGEAGWLRLDEPAMFNLQAVTVAAWIKPESVAGRHGLIGKRYVGTVCPFILSVWDGGLEFEGTDVDGKWSFNFRTPSVLKAGIWQHVAAVVTPGKGVVIYVDGKPVGSKDNPAVRLGNTEPLVIGREAWNGFDRQSDPCYFSGMVDDVKVWGRALSEAEVAVDAAP